MKHGKERKMSKVKKLLTGSANFWVPHGPKQDFEAKQAYSVGLSSWKK